MKRIIFMSSLLMLASIFVFGQSANSQTARQTMSSTDNTSTANDEQTLMGIEQELTNALLKNDPSPFERYLADDYFFTAPDGTVVTKAQNIADVKSGDLKFESSKTDDMKVRSYGNTAVVTFASTDRGKYKDTDLSGKYRWTDVWVKQGGRWQIVVTQGTRLAQQK